MQTLVEGKLVRLRTPEPEDELLYRKWFNDFEINDNLARRYPMSKRAVAEHLESNSRVGYHEAVFAIERLSDGRLIGRAGLHGTSPENRSADLGITIGEKDCWDGGYGTDTMRVLCCFGFEMMNLRRIALEVFADNARARRVYEKVGFQTDGCRREAIYKNGVYKDVVFMSLLEGELS